MKTFLLLKITAFAKKVVLWVCLQVFFQISGDKETQNITKSKCSCITQTQIYYSDMALGQLSTKLLRNRIRANNTGSPTKAITLCSVVLWPKLHQCQWDIKWAT